MLNIKKNKCNQKLVIILEGKLDTITAPELEDALKDELDNITELVFDFTSLEYISSAGLRILLSVSKKMSPDRTMIIKNINEVIKDVFNMTGFDSFLIIE